MKGIVSALVLFLVLSAPVPCSAQTWQPVGPDAGSVRDVDRHPTDPMHLLAVSAWMEAGPYRSLDGGLSWVAVNQGLDLATYLTARVLARDMQNPERLFLATGESTGGMLYRSLDGGDAWSPADVERVKVYAVDVDPADGNRVLYGTNETTVGKLFLSVDGGDSFTEVTPSGLPAVWSILFDPHDGNYVYCGTGTGLWRSGDGGLTWADTGATTRTVAHISSDPHRPGTIYLSTRSYGLWRSDDRGDSLVDILGNLTLTKQYSRVAVDPVLPDRLWVGSGEGVFLSEDSGESWEERNTGLDSDVGRANAFVETVVCDPELSGKVWAGTDSGLYETVDHGGSWSKIGVPAHNALHLTAAPDDPSDVIVGTDWGLYHPEEEGGYAPGAECVFDSGFKVHSLETAPDGWVFDGIATSFYDAVLLRTLDGCHEGGTTEFVLNIPGGDSVSGVGIAPDGSGVVLAAISWPAAGDAALFRSVEGGGPDTFTAVPGTRTFDVVKDFSWKPGDPMNVVAVAKTGILYESDDGGQTWIQVRDDSFMNHYQIIHQPDNPKVIYLARDGGIDRSRNGGNTWNRYAFDGEDVTAIQIPANDPDVMFASIRGGGVQRSEDRGGSWAPIGDGLRHLGIYDLEFRAETDRLFAGTRGGGVYLLVGAGRIGPDLDLDTVTDAADNCPAVANEGQENDDGDPVGDACDCAPADPDLYRVPAEITGLTVDKGVSGSSLSWDDPRSEAGPATGEEVVSGDLSDLSDTGDFTAATCLASDLPGPSFEDTRSDPVSGDGYYYLVRAVNGCGAGTHGDGSLEPDPRDDLDSAGPCP